MLRTAVILCLLGLLSAEAASAHPARATWFFWLSKPERHGSRKMAGDFTHINTEYPYHSREQHKLFSFRRFFAPSHPNLARHESKRKHGYLARRPGGKHTTGPFERASRKHRPAG